MVIAIATIYHDLLFSTTRIVYEYVLFFMGIGGRFFEWLLSLWIGIVVPLSALRIGFEISAYSKYRNELMLQFAKETGDVGEDNSKWVFPLSSDKRGEYLLFIVYCLSTLMIILIPFVFLTVDDYYLYALLLGNFLV